MAMTTPEFVRRMSSDAPAFPAWAAQFITDGRRAEVLMIARDARGAVWLHRKGEWRLPTGTIKAGEDVRACLAREVVEEFGAPLPVIRALGTLRLEMDVPTVPGAFRSHLFLLDAGNHLPTARDSHEGIDGWRAVPVARLRDEAAHLRSLRPTDEPNGWRQPFWGAFRALEQDLVADLLSTERAT